MTRNGKIARLPQALREELNERLHNGEPGVQLVDWLNDLDEVWDILGDDFDDVPISEQNLSEWKRGGYQSWVETREARELVVKLALGAGDVTESAEGANLGECLATLLMVELMKLARVLVQQEEDPQKKWKQVCEINRELSRLRKDRTRDIRTALKQKQSEWAEADRERKLAAEEKERLKKQQLAPYRLGLALHLKAEGLGGGPAAERQAARLLEVEHDLPKGRLQHQDNGVWMWEENEWKWFVDRKEGRGFEEEKWKEVEQPSTTVKGKKKRGKHPTTNIEQPTSNEGKNQEREENDPAVAQSLVPNHTESNQNEEKLEGSPAPSTGAGGEKEGGDQTRVE